MSRPCKPDSVGTSLHIATQRSLQDSILEMPKILRKKSKGGGGGGNANVNLGDDDSVGDGVSSESYVFLQNYYLISFFIAMDTKQSRKKRKQGKSPETDHQNDKQVATATTTRSKASKSGQKKSKLKNPKIIVLVHNIFMCYFYIPVVSILF